jgi:hypothetical protein
MESYSWLPQASYSPYLYHGVYNIYLSMENGMFDLVFSNFIIDVQRIKKP